MSTRARSRGTYLRLRPSTREPICRGLGRAHAHLARLAQSGELERVRIDSKLEFVRQSQDLGLDPGRIDRQHRVAAAAQQVVVVTFVTQGVAVAAVYVDPCEHAVPLEQIERPIHGCAADAFGMQLVRECFRVNHTGLGHQRSNDNLAWPSHALASLGQSTQQPISA